MNFFINILIILLSSFPIIKTDYYDNEDEKPDPGYEKLLEWGKSHNLTITEKIRLVKEKNEKLYIAKNIIPEDDIIMDIPPDCMLNINRTLSLLNSKKFRKAFEKYTEVEKLNQEIIKDSHHIEQAFIAYVLYIVNKHKKNMKKIISLNIIHLCFIFLKKIWIIYLSFSAPSK